jgi:hypothetical protein
MRAVFDTNKELDHSDSTTHPQSLGQLFWQSALLESWTFSYCQSFYFSCQFSQVFPHCTTKMVCDHHEATVTVEESTAQ